MTRLLSWSCDVTKSDLNISKHLPAILDYIKSINAELVCLQEIELNTFESDFFKELLSVYKYARHLVCMRGKHKRTNTFGDVTMWKNR